MILTKETIAKFGYAVEDLKPASTKLIVCLCDHCGNIFYRAKCSVIKKSLHACPEKACISAIIKKSFLAKYGTDNPQKNKVIREKTTKTCLEKYGASSPLSSKEIQDKIKETCLQNLGVENPFLLKSVQDNIKRNNIEKYGCVNLGSLKDIREKIKKTTLATYGVACSFQSEEVKNKIKETLIAKYGTDNPQKNKVIREKTTKTCLEKYGTSTALTLPSSREALLNSNLEKYGAAYPASQNHKTEKEIQAWLKELGFIFLPDHTICFPKELDLVNHDLKLAIEYCGLFWHCEDALEKRDNTYHFNKYKMCEAKGYRLITIFEDEWKERNLQCKNFIKAVLNLGTKVYGRKCTVIEINKKEAQSFIAENHIQGNSRSGFIWFGLFFENSLLGVLELGNHHRGKGELVLTRLCFKDGYKVLGGSSKLFSRAIAWMKINNYKSIKSWSDNRWSVGCVYNKLNFVLEKELTPDYSYINLNGYKGRYSKQSQKKNSVSCPEDKTELQWAKERGLSRIWDCGKKVWKFTI